MKRVLGLAALTAALLCGTAQAQKVSVKIGVLSDMSSLYADIGGPGSVAAAKLAVADRYYVMEHGRVAETFLNSELDANLDKLHDYLGV